MHLLLLKCNSQGGCVVFVCYVIFRPISFLTGLLLQQVRAVDFSHWYRLKYWQTSPGEHSLLNRKHHTSTWDLFEKCIYKKKRWFKSVQLGRLSYVVFGCVTTVWWDFQYIEQTNWNHSTWHKRAVSLLVKSHRNWTSLFRGLKNCIDRSAICLHLNVKNVLPCDETSIRRFYILQNWSPPPQGFLYRGNFIVQSVQIFISNSMWTVFA